MTTHTPRDMYQETTNKIIALLEQGEIVWRKNWRAAASSAGVEFGIPANWLTKIEYRGSNTIMLLLSQMLSGYKSQWWLTFQQAKKLGGSVRKGEHGTTLIYWNFRPLEVETKTGDTETRQVPFLKSFTVFNADQIDDIDFTVGVSAESGEAAPPAFDAIEAAEAVLAAMPNKPLTFHNGGDEAYYIALTDTVHMPTRDSFFTPDAYYATLFHELAHSTGHRTRLDRPIYNLFGTPGYAREELIAELTAAFVCMMTGIAPNSVENSAAYIQNWIKRLKDDPQAFIVASGKAQHAADYILNRKAFPEKDATEGEAVA